MPPENSPAWIWLDKLKQVSESARKKAPEPSATDNHPKVEEAKRQLIDALKSIRPCGKPVGKDEQVFDR